jgi:hypothetical protein
MIVSFANIMSTTILLEVSEIYSSSNIYIGASVFLVVVSISIFFQMKDIIFYDNKSEVTVSNSSMKILR